MWYCASTYRPSGLSAEYISNVLFNGNTDEGGTYKGIMLSKTQGTICFKVTKKVKIYAYGHNYGDSGGGSGQKIIVKNVDTNVSNEYDTKADGNKYELMTLEPGDYELTAKANYVNFDEWEYDVVN